LENSIVSIIKYLVIKRLAGDTITILAVKEYLVDGASPSTIGYKYHVSKFRIRGYVQRVVDKAHSHAIAAAVVRATFPYIMGIDPIILKIGGKYVCILCDTQLRQGQVEHHIRRKHKDIVNNITSQIIIKLRRSHE